MRSGGFACRAPKAGEVGRMDGLWGQSLCRVFHRRSGLGVASYREGRARQWSRHVSAFAMNREEGLRFPRIMADVRLSWS